jgi:ornithine decarboxylase
VAPERISFGNTIKKEADISWAHRAGVSLFAFDSDAELDKIARSAPGAKVFCRILTEGEGALWPLNRKFGCAPEMAADLLVRARAMGLVPAGVSFHVGSQQLDPAQWDGAIAAAKQVFDRVADAGIDLDLLDLGGGFPARYDAPIRDCAAYGAAIMESVARHFGNRLPRLIVEPGASWSATPASWRRRWC